MQCSSQSWLSTRSQGIFTQSFNRTCSINPTWPVSGDLLSFWLRQNNFLSNSTTPSCNLCHRDSKIFNKNNWVSPGCREQSLMQSTAPGRLPWAELTPCTSQRVLRTREPFRTFMHFGVFPGKIHQCSSRILHKLGRKITSVSGGYIAISMDREGEITSPHLVKKKIITRESAPNPL